jgi:hypothetical protein
MRDGWIGEYNWMGKKHRGPLGYGPPRWRLFDKMTGWVKAAVMARIDSDRFMHCDWFYIDRHGHIRYGEVLTFTDPDKGAWEQTIRQAMELAEARYLSCVNDEDEE